jgi:hypothetical protein
MATANRRYPPYFVASQISVIAQFPQVASQKGQGRFDGILPAFAENSDQTVQAITYRLIGSLVDGSCTSPRGDFTQGS